MVDINGLRCYIHMKIDCCETGDNPSLKGILEAKKDGQKAVESYVKDRLMLNKAGVFAPLVKACRKTFASLRKRVSKAKGHKVTLINADRAFFSHLLIIANTRTLNLKEVSEYELSAVPYSIAYPDGSLCKGTKSKLLLELEKETVVSENLTSSEEQETTWIWYGDIAYAQVLILH